MIIPPVAGPLHDRERQKPRRGTAGHPWVALRQLAGRSAIIVSFAFVLAACGKMAPPTAPARFTIRAADLAGIQRGSLVLLTWPPPRLVEKESDRNYIAKVEIFRLNERRDQDPVLDPDDYEDAAQPVGVLDRAQIEAQIKAYGRLEFPDSLNLTDAANLANTRLRYAVRYVNAREQPALFSNTVAIEPVAGVAQPPFGLAAVERNQDAVSLTWSAPEANVNGATPATVVGYNLYRRNSRRAALGDPVNSDPITATSYTDTSFQYGVEYVYVIRALSQGTNGFIESADSVPLAYTPKDIFPPSRPDPVTIASANGVISLFWPSSPERDVAGYNVYRAAAFNDADPAVTQWTKLTPQPITTVTFRDDAVRIDQVYFYKVTAIDRYNNESNSSSVVHEAAHP